ncbi:hypothetical protein EGR_00116 [Echinococcus granulosus]|uniref:Uncharacterized protein n=1 Tax=Echinococcus granulosus TaxID=6210 RepID=W6V1M4_ECHGR|nr:hypothetical protein EGR_00116 [Echinococcus granulosus]EUB64847.1 hypothetical protein EGR_00116 [Echinococcus granulosus]
MDPETEVGFEELRKKVDLSALMVEGLGVKGNIPEDELIDFQDDVAPSGEFIAENFKHVHKLSLLKNLKFDYVELGNGLRCNQRLSDKFIKSDNPKSGDADSFFGTVVHDIVCIKTLSKSTQISLLKTPKHHPKSDEGRTTSNVFDAKRLHNGEFSEVLRKCLRIRWWPSIIPTLSNFIRMQSVVDDTSITKAIRFTPMLSHYAALGSLYLITIELNASLVPTVITSDVEDLQIAESRVYGFENRKCVSKTTCSKNHLSLSYAAILGWLLSNVVDIADDFAEKIGFQTMASLQHKYSSEVSKSISTTKKVSVTLTTLIMLKEQYNLSELQEWVTNTSVNQLIDGVSHYQDLWNPNNIPYCSSDHSLDSYVNIRLFNWPHNHDSNQLESAFSEAVGMPGIFWSIHDPGTRDPVIQDSWTPTSDLINSAAQDLSDDVPMELDGEIYQGQPESTLITFDLPKNAMREKRNDYFIQIFSLLAGLQVRGLHLAGSRLGWIEDNQPVLAFLAHGPRTRWFGPRFDKQMPYSQLRSLEMNPKSWLISNIFTDIILLVSTEIESVGWIISIAFNKLGYRLIGLSANQTPHQLQRDINANMMDVLSKRFGGAHLDKLVKFISIPFTLLILRRPDALRFSASLLADLYNQNPASIEELFFVTDYSKGLMDALDISYTHTLPELQVEGQFPQVDLPGEMSGPSDCPSFTFLVLLPIMTLDQLSNIEYYCNTMCTPEDEKVSLEVHQTLRFARLLEHLLGTPHVPAGRLRAQCIAAKWIMTYDLSDRHWSLFKRMTGGRDLARFLPKHTPFTCQGTAIMLVHGAFLKRRINRAKSDLHSSLLHTENTTLVPAKEPSFQVIHAKLTAIIKTGRSCEVVDVEFGSPLPVSPNTYLSKLAALNNVLYNCVFRISEMVTRSSGKIILRLQRVNAIQWLTFLREDHHQSLKFLDEEAFELSRVLKNLNVKITPHSSIPINETESDLSLDLSTARFARMGESRRIQGPGPLAMVLHFVEHHRFQMVAARMGYLGLPELKSLQSADIVNFAGEKMDTNWNGILSAFTKDIYMSAKRFEAMKAAWIMKDYLLPGYVGAFVEGDVL